MGTNNCTGATRLSIYYAGRGIIPLGTVGYPYGVQKAVPMTGPIALSNFYGAELDVGMIVNGNFASSINPTEDATKFKFLGWTIFRTAVRMNQLSTVVNCLTPPTTTPLPALPPGATSPGDDVAFSSSIPNNPNFNYRIIDTTTPLYTTLAVAGSSEKYVLELSNQATFAGAPTPTNPNMHGILRGPVLVSDYTFELEIGKTISFNWRAAKDPAGDQFAVFIYLLKTNSCEKIVLLDAYGTSTNWQSFSRTIVSGDVTGVFKFVAIHGSFDSTGGLKVGSYLYLHDIKVT